MAPHGMYPCAGGDAWVAIACRNDEEWEPSPKLLDSKQTTAIPNVRLAALPIKTEFDAHRRSLDKRSQSKFDVEKALQEVRCTRRRGDDTRGTHRHRFQHRVDFGLWPTVKHT